MRVTEQLIRDNLKKKQQKEGYQEEEETLIYGNHKKQKPLNAEEDIFERRQLEGINTKESIFDRTAVFHTGGMQP